jgi:tetratricopeptide (TPR) repeat protein
MKKITLTLFFLFIALNIFAQDSSDKNKAVVLEKKALTLIENKKYEDAILLLEQAKKLDPGNIEYEYQTANVYYEQDNYKKAIDILEKLTGNNKCTSDVYVLLGECYNMVQLPDKSIDTFARGMKQLPNETGLFYEKSGLLEYHRKKYAEAIAYWEEGTKVAPNFAGNYYYLSFIFSLTEENIWTIFYGELFLNLERDTQRYNDTSKNVYNTYKKTFVKSEEFSGETFMTKNITIDIDMNKPELLNFELSYALAYTLSNKYNDGITINTIYLTKKEVLTYWFDNKHFDTKFQNSFLEFEKKMLEANVYEAYIYFNLAKGNTDEYNNWYKSNQDKVIALKKWTEKNRLVLNKDKKYVRTDYQ